jgi:uncharacterized membrane protein YhhN
MIALTFVCATACAVLVLAEYRKLAALRIGAKLVASLAFLAVGILAATAPARGLPAPQASLMGMFAHVLDLHAPSFTHWMIAGLALGVAGDAALLGRSNAAFMAGLGAFLLGHIAYVVGVATLLAPGQWPGAAQLAAVLPLAAAAVVLVYLWKHLGSMRAPVMAYMLAIVLMVIGALAVARYDGGTAANRLALGAVIFFASDFAVARDKFIGASFTNRAWGLPAYYTGQLLIAWSLFG